MVVRRRCDKRRVEFRPPSKGADQENKMENRSEKTLRVGRLRRVLYVVLLSVLVASVYRGLLGLGA